jgi:5-oxoprolinase (ATP-hydrolysing)
MAEHGEAPIEAVKMGHHRRHHDAPRDARASRDCSRSTRGLGDALRIGYQARPNIFARRIVLPEPLYSRVVEIDERMTADGETLRPLDLKRRGAISKPPSPRASAP